MSFPLNENENSQFVVPIALSEELALAAQICFKVHEHQRSHAEEDKVIDFVIETVGQQTMNVFTATYPEPPDTEDELRAIEANAELSAQVIALLNTAFETGNIGLTFTRCIFFDMREYPDEIEVMDDDDFDDLHSLIPVKH